MSTECELHYLKILPHFNENVQIRKIQIEFRMKKN